MYCKYCGEPLKDNDRVCPSCGAPVERETGTNTGYGSRSEFDGVKGAPNQGAQTYYNGASKQSYNYSGGNYQYESSADNGSIGWGILGCCAPLVGLILFLVWKDTKPRSAKQAGIGAIIGTVCIAILWILLVVFMGISIGAVTQGEFDLSELEKYLEETTDIMSNVFGAGL